MYKMPQLLKQKTEALASVVIRGYGLIYKNIVNPISA